MLKYNSGLRQTFSDCCEHLVSMCMTTMVKKKLLNLKLIDLKQNFMKNVEKREQFGSRWYPKRYPSLAPLNISAYQVRETLIRVHLQIHMYIITFVYIV